jgi:hypothetical protein
MEREKVEETRRLTFDEAERFALGAFLANRKLFLRRNSNPLHQLPDFPNLQI